MFRGVTNMLSKLRTLINTLDKTDKTIRVLTFPTHEGYQTLLGQIPGVEWHLYHPPNGKNQWDYHTRPLPKNHYLYLNGNIGGDVVFDCVLSQEPMSQFSIADSLRNTFAIPLLGLFHTEVYPNTTRKRLEAIHSYQKYDRIAFITNNNKNSWGFPENITQTVIPHGIDHSLFQGYNVEKTQPVGISICNHIAQRDVFCGWSLFQQVAAKVPLSLIGENPGLSTSISNTQDLVSKLLGARFYFNSSQLSPCPLSLLEAACAGMPILTTANMEVPKIFTHGVNALMSNNENDLIEYARRLLEDKELCTRLGNAARQLMIEKFGMDQFIGNWQRFLRD